MKANFKIWLFYILIFAQLQLDLWLHSFNLHGLLTIIMILFVFQKKQLWLKNSFTLLALGIERFIVARNLLILDSILIFMTFFSCKILKKNINFKNLVFYPTLIIYPILQTYLANTYFFKIPLVLPALVPQLLLNLIYAAFLVNFTKQILLEN